MTFPANFLWGVATSAYQIEGAVHEDGRGLSIWDTFSTQRGAIANSDIAVTSANHYFCWQEDLEILSQLGVNAYRFSISWPRIQPDGKGQLNTRGVDFYSRLLDDLLEREISPVVTLYHWDLPQYLGDQGGWTTRETAYRFSDYAEAMAEHLGDRVHTWTTLNEPWCSAYLGYASGVHAPGESDPKKALLAVHHLNLAHGLGVSAIRSIRQSSRVSVTLVFHVARPENPGCSGDVNAAKIIEILGNDVFLYPMLDGSYPKELFDYTDDLTDWSFVRSDDLAEINQPLDVLGVNYYSSMIVRKRSSTEGFGFGATPWLGADQNVLEIIPPKYAITANGSRIDPVGLTDLLVKLNNLYPKLPLLITENGVALNENLTDRSVIHDVERIRYLREHIDAVERALESGANIEGYFVWTLLDNFEWSFGFGHRYGLIYVDFDTKEREWKDSAYWYRNFTSDR